MLLYDGAVGFYGSYGEADPESALGILSDAPGDASRLLGTREVRRLVDLAVRSSTDGVVITEATHPDNPIVYVNPAFERMTGFSAAEAVGKNCRFLQGDSDRDQPALDELRAALEAGRECRVVLRNRRKDGTPFWNELHVSPVYDEEGRLANFVGVQTDVTRRKRDEEERDLLLLREQAAREEAEAARARLGLLARAGAVLSESLQYSETIARVARLTVPEFTDWCLVDIMEEDGSMRQLAAAHADPEKESILRRLARRRELDAEDLDGTERLSLVVAKTGEPLLLPEVTDEDLAANSIDQEHLELLRTLEPRSYLCVPLRARGRSLGVMVLVSSRKGRRYGPEDVALAEDLAHRCALAVDNARLYRARGEVARTLQGSLLPACLPEVPNVEVGLRYLPAGEEMDVGGDFYDLFEAGPAGPAGPSCWDVVIGDVCGKGAAAAAMLALARYTIRAVAMRETGPAEVLAGLNEAMLRQRREHDDHKFCTVAYARLETDAVGAPGDGTAKTPGAKVTVVRGGHAAPILLGADGSTREVGTPGRAIGVFDDANLCESEVRLAPGDSLVLYTDGVAEARSPDGTFFGEERLLCLLRSCAGLDASSLAARIESAVLDFQENGARDDIAILVLRVPG